MYLIDTDVISALRRPEMNPRPAEWIRSIAPEEAHLSTATIVEIERGIHRQRRKNLPHAEALTRWLDAIIAGYGERILPINIAIARRWGALSAALGHDDYDLAIAATALEHGLTMVTRNVHDFIPTGVTVLDPFAGKLYPAR